MSSDRAAASREQTGTNLPCVHRCWDYVSHRCSIEAKMQYGGLPSFSLARSGLALRGRYSRLRLFPCRWFRNHRWGIAFLLRKPAGSFY